MKPLLMLTLALAGAFAAPTAAAAHQPGYGHHGGAPIIVNHGHPPHQYFDGFQRGTFLHDYRHGPVLVIRDWRALGVYAPRRGHEWVRVRGDLLLVNPRSGRIIDVIPARRWRYS